MERGRKFTVAMPVVRLGASSWSRRSCVTGRCGRTCWRARRTSSAPSSWRYAALAASGTVTLELALFGTPMVVAYKVEPVMAPVLRRLITSKTSVLPNLVLGEQAIPEFHQENCTGARIANALAPLLDEGSPERDKQLAALARVPRAHAAEERHAEPGGRARRAELCRERTGLAASARHVERWKLNDPAAACRRWPIVELPRNGQCVRRRIHCFMCESRIEGRYRGGSLWISCDPTPSNS